MRRLLPVAAVVVVVLLATVGCTDTGHQSVATTTDRRVIDLGGVGRLPAAPVALAPTAKLTVPAGIIQVPGRFPVGTIVTFRIPLRNDGRQPLVIDKLEPG